MKKLLLIGITPLAFLFSCQSQATKDATKGKELAKEAIAIHDEIMPEIQSFDRMTIQIDSLLDNWVSVTKSKPGLDTALVKSDLITLKNNLQDANDQMMTWMHEYAHDSTDIKYQTAEIEKVKAMKKQFDDVNTESNKKLAPFK